MGRGYLKRGDDTDWREEVRRYKEKGLSLSAIVPLMRSYFPDLDDIKIHRRVRTALDAKPRSKKTVGVFSDTHIPFHHPNYLQFVIDTFKKHNVGTVVCLGDLVDNHAISRHQTETSAKSPYDELDLSIQEIAKYTKAFPKVKMVLGNHDLIAIRQAATLGLGDRFLKPLSELLQLPAGWELADEYIIDDVVYRHGVNCTGVNGALNAALRERMSTCVGHTHSNAGVSYAANKRNIIFGAHCGCGIDVNAYAFAYGAHAKNRPIIGCTIVYDSGRAEFIPLSAEYFRGQ